MNFTHWQNWLFIGFCAITLIQVFYYLFFFSRLAFFKPGSKMSSRTHPVSVIICARDEAANLALNLPGSLVQQYSTTHEVIVVDDNSYDDTRYLLEELAKEFKQLHVIELKQEAKMIPGKKFPLSMGIKGAKYEVVLLTDADCVPATENWISTMQNAYDDDTEIVLGYGAYHKKKGLLNKLIRWETFHTALQYLSYALAGTPYMGVGRNLSYKRSVFFRLKGFSSHHHVQSGDDDLFVNMAATKKNTRICIDKNAFTLSQPAKNWREWVRQKHRHYSTGKYYKPAHKFLLGLYAFSHFLFYPLMAASLLFFTTHGPLTGWEWVLIVFGTRFIIQSVTCFICLKKLDEKDLAPWVFLFDIWMFFYYFIFSIALVKKPRPSWK